MSTTDKPDKVVMLRTRGTESILRVIDGFRVQAADGKFNAFAMVAVEPDGTKHTHIAHTLRAKTDSLLTGLELMAHRLKNWILESADAE